ncbi:MAG: glycine zipper 2TM domain-containing protein [Ramlibacter sp.]
MRSVLLISLLATAAVGLHAETFFDTARVRSVDPQYETVSVPRQECSRQLVNEVRQTGGEHQYGGAVVGGLAGALLGNQVGRGHGREAATALGAVVGAFTGDSVANREAGPRYEQVPREVTTCRTVNDMQTRVAGYRVGYDYHGQSYTTLMRENPGPALQVRVSVDPVVGP